MSETARKYLGQTIEIRAKHQFEIASLEKYLTDAIPGFGGPLEVRQFAGGQSNPTYLLTTPAGKYVLRRKPPGNLLPSAHAVDREFRVLKMLFEAGFPVPEPLLLCEDQEVVGTSFYVMRHVEGRIFLDVTLPDLRPDERAALYDSMTQVLAQLHGLDYEAIGLGDFGRRGNFFERQVARWTKQYEMSKTIPRPFMDKLIAWLPTAIPEADETCVTHGDFSFHNVIVHSTEPRVVAVLDWELATLGHPLGDVMYHGMTWYRPPSDSPHGTLLDADLSGTGIPTFEQYLARYCELTGRPAIDNPGFYQAFNLFRTASILQGVVARANAGTAAESDGEKFNKIIGPLAERAWFYAERAGAV